MSSIANSITAVATVAGSSGLIAATATADSPWIAALVTITVSVLAAIPPSLIALAAWRQSKATAAKTAEVDEKATKIEKATDGINSVLTKELAVERAEIRGLRELLASQLEAKNKADAVSLAMATEVTPTASTGSTPAAPVGNVFPFPLPVEIVADSTKETK